MDHRLLSYYNRELQYVRQLGGEFAKQFPKIAGRLGLDAFECADPYVERLLEGFAFLSARVQLKIDSEFPRFTENMLEMVYPHYLAPTPSMAIVQFTPSHRPGTLNNGFVVARGTSLRSKVGQGEQTPCVYRTAHELTLWPLELIGISHSAYVADLGEFRLVNRQPVRGAVRLKFRTTDGTPMNQLTLDRLALFVRGMDQTSHRLYELLAGGALGAVVRCPGTDVREVVPEHAVLPVGFEDAHALLPCGPKSFQGYRLLQEYFALPSRFMFAELCGLAKAARRCTGTELEVVVLLDRHDPVVERGVTPALMSLNCTPAVNLFPRRADRIHLTDRVHEYHVVADRTRPMDLEVHTVTEVMGYGISAEAEREFRPFYSCTERSPHRPESAYYTLHREPRLASSRQRRSGPRSTYAGSEMFISLVDGQSGPYHADLKQISVQTLCSNRDLPLHMSVGEGSSDFLVESGAPVDSVRCVAGPTTPHESHAWGGTSWRLISHLSLNYLSITNSNEGQGAAALRELLQLYSHLTDPAQARQIEGVRSISSSPIVRPLPVPGPVNFVRGLELTLECDETAFEGTSVFLLGLVLEQFFSKYVSLNSFTETVLRTSQRGQVMRWPARLGRRPSA
ncbi:MAG TPA: type VI secretion system baseplate subunit TssF [Polyangiaceae bacterium]|nr:type VI secretion system baseplate subunit TssF [Polyangiaceae bacterium]